MCDFVNYKICSECGKEFSFTCTQRDYGYKVREGKNNKETKYFCGDKCYSKYYKDKYDKWLEKNKKYFEKEIC